MEFKFIWIFQFDNRSIYAQIMIWFQICKHATIHHRTQRWQFLLIHELTHHPPPQHTQPPTPPHPPPHPTPLDKIAAISQTIFSDAFSWTQSFVFWLKFHWSWFLSTVFKQNACFGRGTHTAGGNAQFVRRATHASRIKYATCRTKWLATGGLKRN